ncbi:hypothetical protein [Eubacterium aggregans]|uniref:hypothetical protein n=1 Tax=Eubacterium aggregans TaxID=81409 RepID=UPI003F3434DF
MKSREKKDRMEKTQMLASTFFSDCGMQLLRDMLSTVTNKEVCAPVCPSMRIGGIGNLKGRFILLKTADLLFAFIRTV